MAIVYGTNIEVNKVPSLDLRFADRKSLVDTISGKNLIDFSRVQSGTSKSTYFGADGVLKYADSNEPRFDHDPMTGESLGLLVEESRTNLQTNSTSAALFTPIELTINPNALLAPDGSLTACSLIGNTATSYKYAVNPVGFSVSGTTYTFSFYAKSIGSHTKITVAGTSVAWGTGSTTFDLSAVTATGTGGFTGSITAVGNGWYRCVATKAASASGYGLNFYLDLSNFQGDGTSGIGIWGIQAEVGSFPTSYIPTPATFTSRSTTATYYDANGVIQTAGIDVARDDAYFPDENGVMRPAGLLLEAAGTNINTYSQNFATNTYWLNSSASAVVDNAVTAPDGTATAANFKIGVYTGTTNCTILKNLTVTADTLNTFSIFAKANTYSWLAIYSGGYTNDMGLTYFDLSNSAVGNVGTNVASYSIQKLGSGWNRISVTWNPGADNVGNIRMSLATTNGDFTNIPWDGVASLYVWGAQMEASPYPTSYIPTTTATVTRAADVSSSSTVTRSADVAQITGTNFSSWYNQSEGTVYCNFLAPTRGTGASSYQVVSINDGTVIEHIGLSRALDPVQINANVVTGYSTQALFNIYPIPVGDQKVALSYKSDYSNLAASGILSSADTNLIVPNPTQLSIGQYSAYTTYGLNSTISRLTYYPQRLQDTTLQKLTR